jgi:hypothetical protein
MVITYGYNYIYIWYTIYYYGYGIWFLTPLVCGHMDIVHITKGWGLSPRPLFPPNETLINLNIIYIYMLRNMCGAMVGELC